MLRLWQEECVGSALEKYLAGHSHFQVQATPGAGKTVAAAEIAKRLYDLDKIDLILCFSPSLTIADGIKSTFSWRLGCSFTGGLGSIGASFTYQSMKYLRDSFWETIKKHRVLVVFDEIHHCSGDEIENANVWGEQILKQIQGIAAFTLSLSGTPWRSDLLPITLAQYSDAEGRIHCDYQYGLKQAIIDKVCRSPKIVLIDNDRLSISESGQSKSFSSIPELLKQSTTTYQSILQNIDAMTYVLGLGCKKLAEIRMDNPNAGGLVVASSVGHAIEIQKILAETYEQSTEVVTYCHESPLEKINGYRDGTTQWIISVGMISEGTDIPRLQVCCHLSFVKTELYFRQVLGRILRTNASPNQHAWLYTFAEESLVSFAEQIEKDIPDSCLFIKPESLQHRPPLSIPSDRTYFSEQQKRKTDIGNKQLSWDKEHAGKQSAISAYSTSPRQLDLGNFKERVIAAFL
ncbi:TPA: DEAD/DEAH box helicase family protein [Vibrio vulnificus]|nr:DEAD/DEAH box helicase family protein [Vibrio vulnificus]